MSAILSRLSILFINDISRDLDNTKKFIEAFRSVRGCQTIGQVKIGLGFG